MLKYLIILQHKMSTFTLSVTPWPISYGIKCWFIYFLSVFCCGEITTKVLCTRIWLIFGMACHFNCKNLTINFNQSWNSSKEKLLFLGISQGKKNISTYTGKNISLRRKCWQMQNKMEQN